MLLALTRTALARPLLTVLVTLLLIAAGAYAFKQLPIDAFPDVSAPQVKIIIKLPGMTPEEMEARVTAPIELELLGLPNQTMLRSNSKYGLSDITLDFADGTDIYWARNQVAERLSNVWGSLPAGVSGGMAPLTTPLGEMFMFTLEGPQSLAERRELLDWVIRPALRTVAGVADVNTLGGRATTYEVVPDPIRMNAAGVSLNALRQTLERFNRNDGAGRVNDGEEALLVRVQGSLNQLDDIGALVVRVSTERAATPASTANYSTLHSSPAMVRVRDVAEVRLGALTRLGGVTRDGKGETVEGLVLGLRGANAGALVAGIQAKLTELTAQLPKGLSVQTFYNRAELIDRAVSGVAHALAEAVALVVILLVLFLGNLRAALTVAIVLPLSALWTFILMRSTGLTANLMSLGGLAIAIGMLVDAAVVVVENIVAHLHEADHGGSEFAQEHDKTRLILNAVQEVAVPVAAGIAIIALVFLPLLSLQGLEGKLFSPVALTIIFALIGSLVLSVTVVPLLARQLLNEQGHDDPWLPRQLLRAYTPVLHAALRQPKRVIAGALALLVVTGWVYTLIGKTFMPTMDEGSIIVQNEKLPSTQLDAALALDGRLEKALLASVPELNLAVARAGSDEIGLDPMGLNQTDMFFSLKPKDQWRSPNKADIIDAIRETLKSFPGIAFAFNQPIQMRVSELILGVRGDLAIRIYGPELSVLNEKADAIANTLRGIAGAEDVYYVANEGVQYLRALPDPEALARHGLDIDQLAEQLRMQIEGLNIGTVQKQGRRYPLMIRANGADLSPEQLAALPLRLERGYTIPLGQLVHFNRVGGPVQISREFGSRNTVIVANVRGRDLVGFVEEARRTLAAQVPMPEGYRITYGGEFENQQRAAQRLSVVVPIALALIFLILYTVFDSLRLATLVISNIPFALIGGVLALAASGEYLSVPASVGFIALLGIAVLNGVVLVTYFNQLREQGLNLDEVVIQGAQRRLRPVLLTASMTALGLVPMLFASGPGSEIQKPLAIVVIGGLMSSTALTLIVLPILYRRFAGGPSPSAI